MRQRQRLTFAPDAQAAELDLAGPYARGLLCAGLNPFNVVKPGVGNSPYEILTAANGGTAGVGMPAHAVMPGGYGVGDAALFGESAAYNPLEYPGIIGGGNPPITFLAEFSFKSIGSGNYGIVSFGPSFDTSGLSLMYGASSGKFHLDAPSTNYTAANATPSIGQRLVIAVSLSAMGATPVMYINGIKDGGSGTPTGSTNATADLVLGVELNNTTHQAISNIWLGTVAVWNRVLDEAALRELTLNPYQLFILKAPTRTRLRKPAPASGAALSAAGVCSSTGSASLKIGMLLSTSAAASSTGSATLTAPGPVAATVAKTGTFTLNSTSGNQSITGLGFTPKLVIFWVNQVVTTGSTNEVRHCFGAAQSSTARWVMAQAFLAGTSGFADKQFLSTKCLSMRDSTNDVVQYQADLVSMDGDGFTINVTTPATGVTVNYLALGGSGFQAAVGYFDQPAGTGNFSQTGIGFKPGALLLGVGPLSNTEALTGTAGYSIGIGSGPSNFACVSTHITGSPVSAYSLINSTRRIVGPINQSGLEDARSTLVSLDTDGWTINYTQGVPQPTRIGFIAFGGTVNYDVEVVTRPTVAGSQRVSGLPFQPAAILAIGNGMASASTAASDIHWDIGASDGTHQENGGWFQQNGSSSNSLPVATNKTTSTVVTPGSTSNSVNAEASASFNSDGYTLNWTTVDGIAADTLILAVGGGTSMVTGGGGTTRPGVRDPLKQPFAYNSIWNMPIGTGAVYVAANLTGNPTDPNNSANTTYAPMPSADQDIIIQTPTAPARNIAYSSVGWGQGDRCAPTGGTVSGLPVSVRIPDSYTVPDSGDNNSTTILQPDGHTLVQVEPFTRCTAGGDATAYVRMVDSDLYGDGQIGAHGGSKLSSLGGTLRLGELRPGQQGPQHALGVNVYAKQSLFAATTSTDGYRWPATAQDSYAVGWYGTNTTAPSNATNAAMKMGSLLAIPTTTDITTLGLVTEPAKQLAWTLQNYGAYIVDDTYGPGFAFNTEQGPDGKFIDQFLSDYGFAFQQRVNNASPWVQDIQKLVQALSVVDNNSATSIGGGGTPLQPYAASFSAGAAALSAAASSKATLSAALTTAINASAAGSASCSILANFTNRPAFSVLAQCVSTISADLSINPKAIANGAANCTVSANLSTGVALMVKAYGSCQLSADLTIVPTNYSAAGQTSATLAADLTTGVSLNVAGSTTPSVSASLTTAVPLSASGVASSSMIANMSAPSDVISTLSFSDWLQTSSANRCVLIEVSPLVAGTATPRYLSSRVYTTSQYDTPANTAYQSIVTGGVKVTNAMTLGSTYGLTYGDIELRNTEGSLDAWLQDIWDNKPIQIYVGDVGWPRSKFVKVFDGVVGGIDSKARDRLNIKLRDKLERLNNPITETKLGGTTANKDKVLPLTFGEVHNVSPLLTDPAFHEYMVHNGPIEDIIEVRDNGVPITVTKALSQGKFYLVASPVGTITASVQGAKPAVYSNTIASLIKLLVTSYGPISTRFTLAEIDTANFDAFDTNNPQPVGIYIDSTANVLPTCQMLAQSVGAQLVVSPLGLLQLKRIDLNDAQIHPSSFVITENDMYEKKLSISGRSTVVAADKVGFCKNWTVQTNLTSGIVEEHKALFEEEWLTETLTNTSVANEYNLSTNPLDIQQRDTMLLKRSDANAECQRYMNLYQGQRTTYQFEGTPRMLQLEIGQSVMIDHSRFGLSGGKAGVVTSLTPDWMTNRVIVEVTV